MRIVIGVALFVVGVFVGALLLSSTTTITGTPLAASRAAPAGHDPAVGPKPGECVNIHSVQTLNTADVLDCADPTATYEVAGRGASGPCPTDSYDQFTQPDPGGFRLCLMLNGHNGDCFTGFDYGQGDWKSKVDCQSTGQAMMVSGRFDWVDPAACPKDSQLPLVYTQPARTICLT